MSFPCLGLLAATPDCLPAYSESLLLSFAQDSGSGGSSDRLFFLEAILYCSQLW